MDSKIMHRAQISPRICYKPVLVYVQVSMTLWWNGKNINKVMSVFFIKLDLFSLKEWLF